MVAHTGWPSVPWRGAYFDIVRTTFEMSLFYSEPPYIVNMSQTATSFNKHSWDSCHHSELAEERYENGFTEDLLNCSSFSKHFRTLGIWMNSDESSASKPT